MWHIGSMELTFHHSPERCHLSLMGIIPHLGSDKATLTPVHLVLRARSSLTSPHSQGPHLLLVISPLLDISALLRSVRDWKLSQIVSAHTTLPAFPTHCPIQGVDTGVLCLRILTTFGALLSHLHVLTWDINPSSTPYWRLPGVSDFLFSSSLALEILFWFIFLWLFSS